jgi:PIN domain nuclease of toxin-antitoxin system
VRLLLDSHSLIWAVEDLAKLGSRARAALRDPANDLLVSAATVWELAIKVGLRKLQLSLPYRTWVEGAIANLGAEMLPISIAHADAQLSLQLHHRDPFDRLLIVQATVENLSLVSIDAIFDRYGVTRIWE